MSSPFGHSLAGYVISSCKFKTLKPQNVKLLFFYIFIANAPDLDFLPGLIIGKPNLFHHGISHSLGAGILFSLILTFIINRKHHQHIRRDFLLFLSLYSSHLFLDYLSFDSRPPLGIPLFWPLSNKYYIFPLLPGVKHSALDHATIREFLEGVFSTHNLFVISLEFIVMIPFILLLLFSNRYFHKRNELSL